MELLHNSPFTLVELLCRRAERDAARRGYIFVGAEGSEDSLTYAELDRSARAVGATLRDLGARGERVILLYPPGLDFVKAFFGCLYAGAVAVPTPALPPRPKLNHSLFRVHAIANDARPRAVLTVSSILSKVASLFDYVPALKGARWVATDTLGEEACAGWRDPGVKGEDLAFLQYTSGSTSSPKGVMVSHRNLVYNSEYIRQGFGHTDESVGLTWLPHFHDMGLIDGIIQPLYAGFPCFMMSPVSFLQSPHRWLKLISENGVTHSGGPNFAYDLCVRKVTAEQRESLDLSRWAVAYDGAEPVRVQTLEAFAEAFAPCGFDRRAFYPAYGLAEATLKVSGGARREGAVFRAFETAMLEKHRVVEGERESTQAQTLVGSGRASFGTKVVIVRPDSLTLCAEDEVGEIWISGPGVAGGYWNLPEESARTFEARLADTGEGPFLRTGDLGFLRGEELFVTGRIKDLIIIRGLNHYPQDIELTTERCHPALRLGGTAAFSVEAGGEERLVVVQEVNAGQQGLDKEKAVECIRESLVENHEVQPYALLLVKPGQVPRTSSGKLQRGACREKFLSGQLEVLAEWRAPLPERGEAGRPSPLGPAPDAAEAEGWLRRRVAAKAGGEASRIDATRPVTHYGLDSLAVVELTHEIESTFGRRITPALVLEAASLGELARTFIEEQQTAGTNEQAAELRHQPATGAQPLSAGQQALWLLHRIAPDNSAYNIASALRLKSELDIDALRGALQALVDRHAALRTSFSEEGGEPAQHVHERREVCFVFEDAAAWSEGQLSLHLEEEARRPFDLEQGPLLRFNLFRLTEREHVLLFVVHHIVADLWSVAVLLRELGELYTAEKNRRPAALVPPKLQYTDFIRWQSRLLADAEGARLEAYWLGRLADAPRALDLPTDRPRPSLQTFNGASVSFAVGAELSGRLKELGRERGATLYTTLLAAFQVLLHRYSGQSELLVGSPASGRGRAEFARLVGYFVNPVVMRADFTACPSFEEFLAQQQRGVLGALEHQDYPFPLLVKQLHPERDPSRSPLFQFFFTLQRPHLLGGQEAAPFALGQDGAELKLGGLTLESVALKQQAAQFDLSLVMAEAHDGLKGSLEYNTDLFDASTIERMAAHLLVLLRSIARDPASPVSALPLLTEAERRQLVEGWNQTRTRYEVEPNLARLFEARAAAQPAAVALVFEGEELSYGELNQRANRLAHWLRARGVGPDVRVGVAAERSFEMVVGLLGILKAGGAYVPLDPSYPRERLSYMMGDARVDVLLTQRHLLARLPEHAGTRLCLDDGWHAVAGQSESNPEGGALADNLAYVIYTSGSTGRPKGAMNTHRAVVNRLLWMQDAYRLNDEDRVLQKTPFGFDVSVWEFFWPLMTGARLVLARPGGHLDSAYLIRLIDEQKITTVHFVPSMLQVFLQAPRVEECRTLRRVISSGEALPAELEERFFKRLPAELHNLYGPTEAAVDVTSWACRPEDRRQRVPIGRPISNIQIYIVDARMQPAPVGVAGELLIGGVGLARGYFGRPGLTAERFIPDPFSAEPGARLYRTGDLARRLQGGEIEFLGRIDHQVKVRGNRVELGEVEAALASHPSVREALVVARQTEAGEQSLVAYLVPEPEFIRAHARVADTGSDAAAHALVRSRINGRRHRLPNGLLIAHDGEVQFNTMDIYREIFERQVYLRHGITLSPGDCVLDVGAHIGLFTLFISQRFEGLSIYAFEPVPPTFEALSLNVKDLRPNVRPLNVGLAGESRTVAFNYYPRMTGVSGRVADAEEHKRSRRPGLLNWLRQVSAGAGQSTAASERDVDELLDEYFRSEVYQCRVTTLSEVIREQGIERIDLLKIDVEKSELDVLAGISEQDWGKIRQVVVEVDAKANLERVTALLKEKGYNLTVAASDDLTAGDSGGGQSGQSRTNGSGNAGEADNYMVYAVRAAAPEVARRRPTVSTLTAPRDSALSAGGLRRWLSARLPEYMIPSAFVLLDSLPLSTNGKVDRTALPAPDSSRRAGGEEYVEPRTQAERQLAAIFSEVLGVERVGAHDNFFLLGGHSLLATQVISRVRERCAADLPMSSFFETPTVAGLAEVLARGSCVVADDGLPPISRLARPADDSLLEHLNQLSDEEVEALLADYTKSRGQLDG